MQDRSTIECLTCGFNENSRDARFCGQCASPLPLVCPNCGALNPIGFRFCSQCAIAFTTTTTVDTTRRVVTVLFADICNYTSLTNQLGAENMYLLLNPCLRQLAEIIQRHEGTIDKFTGDGLMAVFGLPIAIEQHAVQATNAALAMFDEIAEYNQKVTRTSNISFQLRIGLASGEVIAGALGSDRHSDLTVIGEAVNLAARLQQSTDPNTLMVSATTAHDLRDGFILDEPIFLWLKGFDEEVEGFLVRGRAKLSTHEKSQATLTPFLGREQEKLLVDNALRLLEGNMGGIVCLTGPAGIGKTRLTTEILARYRHRGVKIYEGECSSSTRYVPYSAFLGIVNSFCNIKSTDSRKTIRKKIRKAVGKTTLGSLIDLVPYIEYLLSIDLVDEKLIDQIHHFDPSQLKRQVFLALREMFVAEARKQPVILVLDDLQWIDSVSLELIEYLADSLDSTPLLLYLIARDEENSQISDFLASICQHVNQRGQTIQLQPLDHDVALRMAHHLLPHASATLTRHIAQQSDGIPFYLEELARHSLELNENLHAIDETELVNTSVPLSLNALMRGRFDRLPQPLARTLTQSAIIGRRFSQKLLQTISDADDIDDQLTNLQERGFITPIHDSDDLWRFQHILTQETVYASMLASQRSQIHDQVGLSLEAMAEDRIDEYADQLAYHFVRSQRQDKAIQYTLQSAQRTAERSANDQALRMFDEVERMIGNDTAHYHKDLVNLNEQRGNIYNLLGRHDDARKAYQVALELAQQYNVWSTSDFSRAYRALASSAEKQAHYDLAQNYLKQARMIVGDGPLLEHARIDADAGWIAMLGGDLNEAERLLSTALGIAELNRHESLQATTANRLAGVFWQRGDLRSAQALVSQSLAMSRRLNDQLAVAKALNNLGVIANEQLDWQLAEDYYKQSMETYMALGDIHGHIRTAYNTATNSMMLGKLNNALQTSRIALLLAQQVGDEFHSASALFQQGMIALLAQDYQRSRRLLIQAECVFRRVKSSIGKQVDIAEQLARLAIAQQRIPLAIRFAHRAIRFAHRDGNPIVLHRAKRVLAFLQSQSILEQGIELFEELHNEECNLLDKGMTYQAHAEALQQQGLRVDAQTYLAHATQIFDLIKVPEILRHFI